MGEGGQVLVEDTKPKLEHAQHAQHLDKLVLLDQGVLVEINVAEVLAQLVGLLGELAPHQGHEVPVLILKGATYAGGDNTGSASHYNVV